MTDYTHDQNIANDTGANVRADINSALQALFSDSASASAPGTTIKSQRWNDYTNFLRKRRNQANSGWIVEGSLDETFVIARSSNTILGISDVGKTIVATSTFTQTFTAAATLGDGWWVEYRNDGTGIITLDPNSSETINGSTTRDLLPGDSCIINCSGSAFKTIGLRTPGQVPFPATQNASSDANTLDDYEEGTWTPTLTCGTSGTITLTTPTDSMYYTKIGRQVMITGLITVSSVSSPVGSLTLGGLPFTAANHNGAYSALAVRANSLAAGATTSIVGFVTINTTTANISKYSAGNGGQNLAGDVQAGSTFIIQATYFV